MTENKLSFEEFEKLLINTINNNYINNSNHNSTYCKDLLAIPINDSETINDYIQIYKFTKKMKEKNKIEKLEKEIEELKNTNNKIMV